MAINEPVRLSGSRDGQLSVDMKDSHRHVALGGAVCSQHQEVSCLVASGEQDQVCNWDQPHG